MSREITPQSVQTQDQAMEEAILGDAANGMATHAPKPQHTQLTFAILHVVITQLKLDAIPGKTLPLSDEVI
tara:strand:- start:139 stop:351 length:213 start_codon:yes stop_codon:yes gene_type:complete